MEVSPVSHRGKKVPGGHSRREGLTPVVPARGPVEAQINSDVKGLP